MSATLDMMPDLVRAHISHWYATEISAGGVTVTPGNGYVVKDTATPGKRVDVELFQATPDTSRSIGGEVMMNTTVRIYISEQENDSTDVSADLLRFVSDLMVRLADSDLDEVEAADYTGAPIPRDDISVAIGASPSVTNQLVDSGDRRFMVITWGGGEVRIGTPLWAHRPQDAAPDSDAILPPDNRRGFGGPYLTVPLEQITLKVIADGTEAGERTVTRNASV